jgi:hypothetical protein
MKVRRVLALTENSVYKPPEACRVLLCPAAGMYSPIDT